jgi:hypothetical protein
MHDLPALDEVQRREGEDAVAIDRGLKREVKTLEGLERGETRGQSSSRSLLWRGAMLTRSRRFLRSGREIVLVQRPNLQLH